MKPVDFERFREDVKVALEGVAKKHGVEIGRASCRERV